MLVLLSTAFAIALPRFTARRIEVLRNEINEIAEPARQRVTQIQLEMALQAAQQRAYLLSGDGRVLGQAGESRARRRLWERELIRYARRLDAAGARNLAQPAERLGALATDLDSLMASDLARPVTGATLVEQRRRFLTLQALGDSLVRAIDGDNERRRAAIGRTENFVEMSTGVALLLGLGAAFVTGRLGRRFRAMALALEERERWSRELAESERAARAVAEHREQELVRVTESRGRLLRGFTHDVKNPLGAADGFLALVEEGVYGGLPAKAGAIVTKVRRSIAQALELTVQLLEIARAESGQLQIRRQPVNLEALVPEVADSFAAQAAAKDQALRVEPSGDVPSVFSDGTRIRQIVGNLISNAVKYTPRGGTIVVRLRTVFEGAPAGAGQVSIDVTDTGPGIPPDKLPLLFTEFTRLDPNAAEGAGIGLAISQKIAAALEGEIVVDSGPGGSTFSLRVPAGDQRAATDDRRGQAET